VCVWRPHWEIPARSGGNVTCLCLSRGLFLFVRQNDKHIFKLNLSFGGSVLGFIQRTRS
jgi:hypothetical protein